jgi:hypothetical protein
MHYSLSNNESFEREFLKKQPRQMARLSLPEWLKP